MKVGDWVRSYSKGVWQIYRILGGFYEPRFSLNEKRARSKRTLVFSKRLVNEKWKKSLSAECCEAAFIAPISKDKRSQVEQYLKDNTSAAKAFEAFRKPIDLILNIGFSLPDRLTTESFGAEMSSLIASSMVRGLTLDEVLRVMEKSELNQFKGKLPVKCTLQLVSPDHKVKNGEFIIHEYRVLSH